MQIYEDMLRGARTKKIVLPQPPKEADDDGSQGRHRSAKNGTSLTASNKGGIVGGGRGDRRGRGPAGLRRDHCAIVWGI